MKAYELNRKTYEKVKKMDHGQMKSFYESMYMRGFEAGKEAARGLTVLEIREVLLQVKGIGEKKADVIIAALEEDMEQKTQKHGKKSIEDRDKD